MFVIMLLAHEHKLRGFTGENEQPVHVKICQGVGCERPYPFPVHSPIKDHVLSQISYEYIDHQRVSKTTQGVSNPFGIV